jgi:hypothetical protein
MYDGAPLGFLNVVHFRFFASAMAGLSAFTMSRTFDA